MWSKIAIKFNMRILFAIVVFALACHSTYGLTINGLIYNVDTESNTAVCTGAKDPTVYLIIPKTIPHPSGKELDVIGISPYAFQNNSSIYKLIINANLSYIGTGALRNCRDLESIEFNGSVLKCENSAFAKCSSITEISFLQDNVTIGDSCFFECSQLKTVALSNKTRTVGKYAFANCTSLNNISLGDSIRNIDNYAFTECNLLGLTLPNSVESIGKGSFYNAFYISRQSPLGLSGTYEVSIPNSVLQIGANAFDGNPIASITLEYGELPLELDATSFTDYPDFDQRKLFETTLIVGRPISNKNEPFRKSGFVRRLHVACDKVSDYQFEGCKNLTNLSFSNHVKSIGRYAFANCPKLTYQLNLKGVETIGEYAFYQCGRINDLDFYEGLKSIGEYAFANCDSIPYIRIPPHLKIIPKNCFAYTAGYKVEFLSSTDTLEVFSLPRSIENVEINRPLTLRSWRGVGQMLTLKHLSCGGTISSIPNQALSRCQAQTVKLSEGIETIGDGAFAWSHKLQRINLPNSVKAIGEEAFYYCSGLREIEIGDSLKSIGKHCFKSSSWLSSIKCTSPLPPVVDGEDIFSEDVYNNAQLTVNYPSGILYKQAPGWRNFTHIKEPIPGIDSIKISRKNIEIDIDKGFFLSCKVYPYYLGCENNIKWYLSRDSNLKLDKQEDGTVYVSCPRYTENEYVICKHVTSENSHDYLADTCFVQVSRPNLTRINLYGESKIVAGVRNKMELDYEHEHFVPSEYVKFTVINLTPDIITLEGEWPKKDEFDVTGYDQLEFFVYGIKSGIGKIKIADSYNPDNYIIEEIECVSNIKSLSFSETELSIDVEDETKLEYNYSLLMEAGSFYDLISLE